MNIKIPAKDIRKDYSNEIFKMRGVKDLDSFLNPTEANLQTWKDLDNIEKGIELVKNLNKDATVGLIVDCDVDGYTSASIIYQYLKQILPDVSIEYYLHEGKAHGLEDTYEHIIDKSYDLLIIPDASSNDSEYAKQLNMPILVLDHHLLDTEISADNMVVVNNQISEKYKNKYLSGAGIAYQFCRGLDEAFGVNYAEDYIDLAALGICADMMSGLETENQYFWKKGFSNVKNFFFWTIAKKQSYSITGMMGATDQCLMESLNPTSVAFYIVPMINAMIRVGTQPEKERLFIAFVDGERMIPCNKRGAKGTLEKAAIESARECTNARTHQNKYKEDAVSKLEQKIFKNDLLENKILFIRLDEDDVFPSELNGLVAMMLSQKYKRPTIVARLNNEGYIRGSARGLNKSELSSFKDFLLDTKLFEYAQGHDNAFGISIKNKDLAKFHEIANEQLKDYNFDEGCYEVDFVRSCWEEDLVDIITDLSNYKNIWSQGCEEPLIFVQDINLDANEINICGKNNDTVRFQKDGVTYIKFFAKDMISELDGHDTIQIKVVGKANMNEWNNIFTPQIQIEAYEIEDGELAF